MNKMMEDCGISKVGVLEVVGSLSMIVTCSIWDIQAFGIFGLTLTEDDMLKF